MRFWGNLCVNRRRDSIPKRHHSSESDTMPLTPEQQQYFRSRYGQDDSFEESFDESLTAESRHNDGSGAPDGASGPPPKRAGELPGKDRDDGDRQAGEGVRRVFGDDHSEEDDLGGDFDSHDGADAVGVAGGAEGTPAKGRGRSEGRGEDAEGRAPSVVSDAEPDRGVAPWPCICGESGT